MRLINRLLLAATLGFLGLMAPTANAQHFSNCIDKAMTTPRFFLTASLSTSGWERIGVRR